MSTITTTAPLTSHSWCATELKWERFTFRWAIEHFTEMTMEKYKSWNSPSFTMANGSKWYWHLVFEEWEEEKEEDEDEEEEVEDDEKVGEKEEENKVEDNKEEEEEEKRLKLLLYLFLESSLRDHETAYARISIVDNALNYAKETIISAYQFKILAGWGYYLGSQTELFKCSESLFPGGKLTIHTVIYVLSDTVHRSGK